MMALPASATTLLERRQALDIIGGVSVVVPGPGVEAKGLSLLWVASDDWMVRLTYAVSWENWSTEIEPPGSVALVRSAVDLQQTVLGLRWFLDYKSFIELGVGGRRIHSRLGFRDWSSGEELLVESRSTDLGSRVSYGFFQVDKWDWTWSIELIGLYTPHQVAFKTTAHGNRSEGPSAGFIQLWDEGDAAARELATAASVILAVTVGYGI